MGCLELEKTSLIQCGLASRLDGPDWYPIWVRKKENINDSLRNAIAQETNKESTGDLVEDVSSLYRLHLRPVYLLFDQFEELFILGTKEEHDQLIEDLRQLFDSELPYKVIFSIREEFIGQLNHFEKTLPPILDYRLRLDPMNAGQAKMIMKGFFAKFNIELAENEDERLQQIVDNIRSDQHGILLPYMQVYLDMLYKTDYVRTYGHRPSEEKYPALEFTEEEIEAIGTIEDVLKHFLDEQEQELQAEISAENEDLAPDTVQSLLDALVTKRGTTHPISYKQVDEQIVIDPKERQLLPDIPDETLSYCLKSLARRGLLRISGNSIGLAHDSLAVLINQKRIVEEKQLNRVFRDLYIAYRAFTSSGNYLDRKQLGIIEPFKERLQLEEKYLQFIDDSYKDIETKENEELVKEKNLRGEAETAQLVAEKKKRKANRRLLMGRMVMIFAILLTIASWVLIDRTIKAKKQAELAVKQAEENLQNELTNIKIANTRAFERLLAEGKYYNGIGEFNIAGFRLKDALLIDSSNIEAKELLKLVESKKGVGEKYSSFMNRGNAAFTGNNYALAMQNYQSARALDIDAIKNAESNRKINETYTLMEGMFVASLNKIYDHIASDNCIEAQKEFNKISSFEFYIHKSELTKETLDQLDRYKTECN